MTEPTLPPVFAPLLGQKIASLRVARGSGGPALEIEGKNGRLVHVWREFGQLRATEGAAPTREVRVDRTADCPELFGRDQRLVGVRLGDELLLDLSEGTSVCARLTDRWTLEER